MLKTTKIKYRSWLKFLQAIITKYCCKVKLIYIVTIKSVSLVNTGNFPLGQTRSWIYYSHKSKSLSNHSYNLKFP